MISCLQNCKPGDLIHCTNAVYVVTSVLDDKVNVNHIDKGIVGEFAGHFYFHKYSFILKITKAK